MAKPKTRNLDSLNERELFAHTNAYSFVIENARRAGKTADVEELCFRYCTARRNALHLRAANDVMWHAQQELADAAYAELGKLNEAYKRALDIPVGVWGMAAS